MHGYHLHVHVMYTHTVHVHIYTVKQWLIQMSQSGFSKAKVDCTQPTRTCKAYIHIVVHEIKVYNVQALFHMHDCLVS